MTPQLQQQYQWIVLGYATAMLVLVLIFSVSCHRTTTLRELLLDFLLIPLWVFSILHSALSSLIWRLCFSVIVLLLYVFILLMLSVCAIGVVALLMVCPLESLPKSLHTLYDRAQQMLNSNLSLARKSMQKCTEIFLA